MGIFFKRRRLLRGTKAALDQFTGLGSELAHATDTNDVMLMHGDSPGGQVINSTEPNLLAELTGVNASTSNYRNWTYAAGLLQPDQDDYLDFKVGRYYAVSESLAGNFTPIVNIDGDHTAAFNAETFTPELVAERNAVVGSAAAMQQSNNRSTNVFSLLAFTSASFGGGATTVLDSTLSPSVTPFFVSAATKLRFGYADTANAVSDNVNLQNVRIRIYGPAQ